MDDTKENRAAFAQVLNGLADNYSAKLSPPGLLMRFKAMQHLSLDEIRAAAYHIIQDASIFRMPTTAEFLDAAGKALPQPKDAATEQVTLITRLIRELGYYRPPTFEDPTTAALLKSRWSWRGLCSMTETELKWFAKEFIEAYQSTNKRNASVCIENLSKLTKQIGGGTE